MNAPSAGARYTLERRSQSEAAEGAASGAAAGAAVGSSARYDATIATPAITYRAELTLRDDGEVTLAFVGDKAPEAFEKALAMFAKLTARSAPARREEGVPVWPARVTRWRPTT